MIRWEVAGGTVVGHDALSGFLATGHAPVADPCATVSFQAIGDSLTSWEGLELTGAQRVDTSWVPTAIGSSTLFLGGWARGGARVADMIAAAVEITADVLVVLPGTNDVRAGASVASITAGIVTLVAPAPSRVLLVAIPPLDSDPERAADLNTAIAALAETHGWEFVDPWVTSRGHDRKWLPGASSDGVHPCAAVANIAGVVIGWAIKQSGA